MYRTLPAQLALALMLVVCAAALWRGRALERGVAAMIAVAWLASGLVQTWTNWDDPHWPIFAIDVVLAIAATAVAIRARPWWVAVFAAFTWLQVMAHVAMLLDDRVRAWAYATAMYFWGVAQLVTLGIGVWEARRGRRPVIGDSQRRQRRLV